MKKWLWILSGVVVAVLAVVFVVTTPSDEQLVRQAIDESAQASQEGRPGGVLDHLSKSLTFNGAPVGDKAEISRVVRLAKPEVKFKDYTPSIDGDKATVIADVYVKLDYLGLHYDQNVRGVKVDLARERGFRWLVFPSSKWRITSVSAPDLSTLSD
ncbi:MAG TPA: hypothetical protein VNI20_13660 [Fimbriimonadaceae bacterium]|nr:hypothetical protein [Fimbriimonadaceae bacterium]